jgi:transcriptional regulator with XRE-family HTH domain
MRQIRMLATTMATTSNTAVDVRQRLAANLREQRQRQSLSQEALADLAGLHRTYVSQVERTVTNVSLDNVVRLAEALNLDVHVLLLPRSDAQSQSNEGVSPARDRKAQPRK